MGCRAVLSIGSGALKPLPHHYLARYYEKCDTRRQYNGPRTCHGPCSLSGHAAIFISGSPDPRCGESRQEPLNGLRISSSIGQLHHRAPGFSQLLLTVVGAVSLPCLCPCFDQFAGTF